LISPLQVGVNTSNLLTIIYLAFFFVFIAFGQQLQYYISIGSISQSVNRLMLMKDKATKETLDYIAAGKPPGNLAKELAKLIDYVTIMPEALDPAGVVPKMEQVVRNSDVRMRSEVQRLVGVDEPVRISVAQNMVEIASALTMIYKVVRHYYLKSRKTRSYFTLVQLQASLPQIMELANALKETPASLASAEPLGDGLGALVASRFMVDVPKESIARDTVLSKREYKGRTLYVTKAEGPMGYIGEPDVAIRKVVEEMKVELSAIIMVDAALKLEGDKTGELVEGMGAAIGGIGTEKFRIEEVAIKHSIPIYAILVKESQAEALTVMRKEIADSSQAVVDAMTAVMEERTKEGDSVLLAGIGNTLGIGQ
jgi:hypothetical protein